MTNPKHTCPECLRRFSYPPSKAGSAVNCPACKQKIRLPAEHNEAAQDFDTANQTNDISTPPPINAKTKPCPFCAEQILDAAVKCKHCGEILSKPEPAQINSTSTVVGIIVAIFGGLIALGSLFMDTTVQTTLGGRVHNIGLQQQQIMGLLLGLAMLLVGTIVALLSKKNSAANQTNLVANQVKTADEISLYLAKNQKYLIWVLCLQFATGLILVLAPQLGGLIALITFVAQVVFVFQIALVVFPGILGAVLATASLVPFFGLLVIAFINSAATAILEKNGVKVSFWGVPKDELTRLESKFQKSEKTNRSW